MLKKILGKVIANRLTEQTQVALSSHAVGVQAIVLAIAGYAMANPEQMEAFLGPKWGAILLAVAGVVTTIARVWNAKPQG